jgi:hypothetical protein
MDKPRVKDMLSLHGFSYTTLENGVRVSALVPGSGGGRSGGGRSAGENSGGKREEDLEILVRATREGTRLESERHSSYEDAAARYVELLSEYREDSRSPSHGPV